MRKEREGSLQLIAPDDSPVEFAELVEIPAPINADSDAPIGVPHDCKTITVRGRQKLYSRGSVTTRTAAFRLNEESKSCAFSDQDDFG